MESINNLMASPGERVLPKWNALLSWIRRQRVSAPGAAVSYTPNGVQILYNPEEYSPISRFAVSLTGGTNPKIIVNDGTINGKIPKVNGVPIIGSDNPPQPQPEIDLVEPDKDGIVMVCIVTTHLPDGSLKEATIECKQPSAIPGGLRADRALSGKGYIPIAMVRHDPQTRKPLSVFQHSVHNLQCRAYRSGGQLRIIYWAA